MPEDSFELVTMWVLFRPFWGAMQMLIRGAGKIIIKVHCLPNPSSPPPKSIESLGWKQFSGENSKMFSTFFLVSAILGSIVHRAVGGPLDCISGPCVTVEGVGKLKLEMWFKSQIHQSHPNWIATTMLSNPNPRKAARKLGAHTVVPSQDQPVHGDSLWGDHGWRTQVIDDEQHVEYFLQKRFHISDLLHLGQKRLSTMDNTTFLTPLTFPTSPTGQYCQVGKNSNWWLWRWDRVCPQPGLTFSGELSPMLAMQNVNQ